MPAPKPWLDRLIGLLSPKWAAERAAWRTVEELAYRNASRTRLDRGSSPAVASADFDLEAGYERESMMLRSRELERDNALADGLLTTYEENVVHTGIGVQALTDDEEWNRKAEERFNRWANDPLECDVRGMDTFAGLQALVARSRIRDGDVGIWKCGDGRLQVIEGDLIASPLGKARLDNRMVEGVELDRRGRPIRFHIVDETDPAVNSRASAGRDNFHKRIVVDAKHFLFLARRKRASQTRGLPVLGATAWMFDQLDAHIEAVIVGSRMAACFGLMIEKPGGFGDNLPTVVAGDGSTKRKLSIEPGMIKELEPGEKLHQIKPEQPHQSFSEFVATFSRFLGLPLGLPLELIMKDFSRTNFSSSRGALLQAYRSFRGEQWALNTGMVSPVYLWKVAEWIAAGELEPHTQWDRHKCDPPGWDWIDPQAEVQGDLAAIDAGFKTATDVCASRGRDFGDVIAKRKAELALMKDAEVDVVRSNLTRDPGANLPGAGAPQPGGAKKKDDAS